MTRFLRFTLFAPLSSWGNHAIGEVRDSWDRPTRAAVLGLVSAAMGVDRGDEEEQRRIDASFGLAVRLLAAGVPMIDFHTVQNLSARSATKMKLSTRREVIEEIKAQDRPAVLSRRTLRQDALSMIALWERDGAAHTLESAAAALREPRFVLYAGRKANPLGLPLSPAVVQAESLAAALDVDPILPPELELLRASGVWGREVAHDRCVGFQSNLVQLREHMRRDTPLSRRTWTFQDRVIYVGEIPAGGKS